jgi:CMP-N-acetylneuraminic acid synthetase
MSRRPCSCLAVIPARGGSKSIPRKNILPFAGKPLLCWTLDVARDSGCFDGILLSTDDPEIADVARRHGLPVPWLRPADLARDNSPTAPAIRHALDRYREDSGRNPDFVFVLEPTAPARHVRHLREAVELLATGAFESLSGISEVPHHYVPEKQLRRLPDGRIEGLQGTPLPKMIHRRQDLPTTYAFNGLVWACASALLDQDPPRLWGERNGSLLIDARHAIDLDTPEDWDIGERRMQHLLSTASNDDPKEPR